jgi:hypothetical protein
MRKGSAVWGPNRMLYGSIFLAMFMSLGHHIDHVIRGNHVGWQGLYTSRPLERVRRKPHEDLAQDRTLRGEPRCPREPGRSNPNH